MGSNILNARDKGGIHDCNCIRMVEPAISKCCSLSEVNGQELDAMSCILFVLWLGTSDIGCRAGAAWAMSFFKCASFDTTCYSFSPQTYVNCGIFFVKRTLLR